MLPPYWTAFLERHHLISGSTVSIPEDRDRSRVGADFEIYDEKGSLLECTDFYPGIRVLEDGYVAVGGCLTGSGDPYFLNERDGEHGPLYRVYHDEVSVHGYDKARAIAIVLDSYEELLEFVENAAAPS